MPFKQHPDNPDLVIYKTNEYCLPKPWQGLTDEEIESIVDANTTDSGGFDIWCDGFGVARAVIEKLKERNT
jgi:hypothetical protein